MILELLLIADVMTAGKAVEHYVVPDISFCEFTEYAKTCTSFRYDINYTVDSCVAPVSAKVVHAGTDIPIRITEEGERGRAGYSWSLQTTKIFAGDVDVEITFEAVSRCSETASAQRRSAA